MEFRRATQEDLEYVKSNPFEGAVKDYPYMEVPDDNTYAVIFEGKLVAVGGVQIKWQGVGLFWLILTADCKKDGFYGVLALSAVKQKTDHLIEKNGLWHAQATVRPNFLEAIKMIEFLGFKRKCLMEKYCPDGGDSYLYIKVI